MSSITRQFKKQPTFVSQNSQSVKMKAVKPFEMDLWHKIKGIIPSIDPSPHLDQTACPGYQRCQPQPSNPNPQPQPKPSFPHLLKIIAGNDKFQVSRSLLIILRYTNLENIKNMTTHYNIFAGQQNLWASQLNGYYNTLSFEDDPIDRFLNKDAFIDRHQGNENDTSNELTNMQMQENASCPPEEKETQNEVRRKSIFHNFQKHLITLIKKFIIIPFDDADRLEFSGLALALWTAFMKTRSFNKKILHMVFGVQENIKENGEFSKLAEEYPEFKRVMNRSTFEEIVEAQKKIREEFIRQAMRLEKINLQSSCNVNRFQEFYEYYQSFISELRSGPMTKRMTKSRKYGVLEKLRGGLKCE